MLDKTLPIQTYFKEYK